MVPNTLGNIFSFGWYWFVIPYTATFQSEMCDDIVFTLSESNRREINIFIPQQGWRWTDWTCTVRNTNLSKASSTWPRLESSRFGRKGTILCESRTNPTRDWGVIRRGVGTFPVYTHFRIDLQTLEGICVKSGHALNTQPEPKLIIQHDTIDAFNGLQ